MDMLPPFGMSTGPILDITLLRLPLIIWPFCGRLIFLTHKGYFSIMLRFIRLILWATLITSLLLVSKAYSGYGESWLDSASGLLFINLVNSLSDIHFELWTEFLWVLYRFIRKFKPNINIRLIKRVKNKQFQYIIRRPHNLILGIKFKQQKTQMSKTSRLGLQLGLEIIRGSNFQTHNAIQYG